MKYSTKALLVLQILTTLSLTASALPALSLRHAKKPPVCIIGAGPAGLSAAGKLESKGIKAVIFEKQAAVGGKCQAYYDEK
jgi:ribulose 1,5-bisphosphate synthetase/thiazole synthase